MQTYSVLYDSVLTFHFLPTEEINRAKSVLVIVQSSFTSHRTIEKILHECSIFFPDAIIVGGHSYGGVHDTTILEEKTLITIHTFDKTRIHVHALEDIKRDECIEAGRRLCKKVLRRDTKLLLLFSDTLGVDSEALFRGIVKTGGGVPLSGCMTADRGKYYETAVFYGEKPLYKGAVLVALNGSKLNVDLQRYDFVKPVGPSFRIDNAEKDRVHRIDGERAFDFYAERLGEEFAKGLPANSLKISLFSCDKEYCRNIIGKDEDGTLRYAGHLEEGGEWKFALFDHEKRCEIVIPTEPYESCILFGDASQLAQEKAMLHPVVEGFGEKLNTTGMFGYGQFFHDGEKALLLNRAFVTVCLGESYIDGIGEERTVKLHLRSLWYEPDPLTAKAILHLGEFLVSGSDLCMEALTQLSQVTDRGVIIYNEKLKPLAANDMAKTILGLDLKLLQEYSLKQLEEWIVELMEAAVRGEYRTRVGSILDPTSGEMMPLRIEVVPLKKDHFILGGIAYIFPEGMHERG
ncbi:FIST N-terminal domain-containing protein [Hydrogenimonas sp. SS33]|uniref:FIST signal transduction protein n=1 Tax=Hydrogenimonas leucolamina TaxID=2954236 RepID=UPI00336BE3D8